MCGLGWGAHLLSTAFTQQTYILGHTHVHQYPYVCECSFAHTCTQSTTRTLSLSLLSQVMSARSFPPGDFGSLGTKKGYVRLTCFTQTAQ